MTHENLQSLVSGDEASAGCTAFLSGAADLSERHGAELKQTLGATT